MDKMETPLEVRDIPGDHFGRVFVGEKKYVWPKIGEDEARALMNFQSKRNDVWIMSLPRSGTTLTQEIVWLLLNNLDYENAKKYYIMDRVPEVGLSLYPMMWNNTRFVFKRPGTQNIFETIECDTSRPSHEEYARIPGPRILKTHLAISMHKNILESGAKIIYIARNQKDRLLSRYRFMITGRNPLWKCDIEDLWRTNKTGTDLFGPTWSHIKEAWALRNNPNFLFLFYEEMRANLPAVLRKIATFLGKTYSDEEFETLSTHLDIENFRKNPSVNVLKGFSSTDSCFIGSGKVGGYKGVIPPEIEKEIDEWIAENIKDTDFEFPSIK